MGGSAVMYLLATQLIPMKKAIIDAGITPYPYPLFVRKLIALKDLIHGPYRNKEHRSRKERLISRLNMSCY